MNNEDTVEQAKLRACGVTKVVRENEDGKCSHSIDDFGSDDCGPIVEVVL